MLVEQKKACLVVFNVQMELIPLLRNGTILLHDCCWLAEVSAALDVPIMVIEHKKLGASVPSFKAVTACAPHFEKTYFNFLEHADIEEALERVGRTQFVFAGAELHVCLFQSAMNLRQRGKDVFVILDAVSARNDVDHQCALKRMEHSGIALLTKEMYFFELIRYSEYPDYLKLSRRFLDGRYIN
jgi:hypothetical protein